MLGLLKELSPLNFIFSPLLSALVVIAAIILAAAGAILVPGQVSFFGFAISGRALLAAVYLFLGLVVFLKRGGSSIRGRTANALIIAGIIGFILWFFAR